jgi:hypothetical protein
LDLELDDLSERFFLDVTDEVFDHSELDIRFEKTRTNVTEDLVEGVLVDLAITL